MKKETKKTIVLFFKRAAMMFAAAFFIFSCNDEDTFDCEVLEANFGDACDSAGVVSLDCECVFTFDDYVSTDSTYTDSTYTDSTYTDSTLVSFDCPELMLNIGDICTTANADSTIVQGIVSIDCDCE